jgi:hypothetical protein
VHSVLLKASIMPAESRERRYEGVHCHVHVKQFPNRVTLLEISGTDVGEFGDAPMRTLDEWIAGIAVDLFIDAREVRGASIDVSKEWAAWLNARRGDLTSVTMLAGSRFIQITAEFVRRFAGLEGIMRICTEPSAFESALSEALRWK